MQVDRKAKRHRRRMAEDLAMSCNNSVMLGSRRATKDSLFHQKHFMDDMEQILKLKCDVSIVSDYNQLFVLADAILQSGLWAEDPAWITKGGLSFEQKVCENRILLKSSNYYWPAARGL